MVLGCAFPLPVKPTPTAAVRPALPRTTTKTHTTTNGRHYATTTTRMRRRPRTTTTRTTPPTTTHRILSYTHMLCRHRRCDFRWGCELLTCLPAGVWAWEWECTAVCRSDPVTGLVRTEEEEAEAAEVEGWSSCDARLRVRGCVFGAAGNLLGWTDVQGPPLLRAGYVELSVTSPLCERMCHRPVRLNMFRPLRLNIAASSGLPCFFPSIGLPRAPKRKARSASLPHPQKMGTATIGGWALRDVLPPTRELLSLFAILTYGQEPTNLSPPALDKYQKTKMKWLQKWPYGAVPAAGEEPRGQRSPSSRPQQSEMDHRAGDPNRAKKPDARRSDVGLGTRNAC